MAGVTLENHQAQHVAKVPEGLYELCSDISREVLRAQPMDIHRFIADYMAALLITRENAKVALRVVNNIVANSQSIIATLHHCGVNLEQIAKVAPKLQGAFQNYLREIDTQESHSKGRSNIDRDSLSSILSLLDAMGVPIERANNAAVVIQRAFRGHYQRMISQKLENEVPWQSAVINTMEILRKAGVSQEEASSAASIIQDIYRGFFTRRNAKARHHCLSSQDGTNYGLELESCTTFEADDAAQAVAWLEAAYQDSFQE